MIRYGRPFISYARCLRSSRSRLNSTKATGGSNTSFSKSLIFFGAGVAATSLVFVTQSDSNVSKTDSTSTTPLSSTMLPKYCTAAERTRAFDEAIKLLGKDNVTTLENELLDHSDTYFNTHHPQEHERPGLIVFPSSTEEVSEIVKIANKYRVPVVPFSGGTSLEGHFISEYSGFCIDFRRMDKIVVVHQDDLDAVVQPGVGWEALNDILKDYDLFFGPDPGPGAQIGGMIGTACSGTNAARYGTMRENVLSLTVVLADGTVIKTKQRPRKSSAGYNLTGLFVGSEGTLGIVTEATLKLVPRPKNESVGVVTFHTIGDAANVVSEVVKHGLQLGAVELLDTEMMKVINKAGDTTRKWTEAPTLFLKFSGTKTMVQEQIKSVREISKKYGSLSFEFTRNDTEKDELWAARKTCLWSTIAASPEGFQAWSTDVAVPVSRLSEIITQTREDMDKSGIFGTVLGHVGDGNFHTILMYDPMTQRKTTEEVVDRMVQRALSMEGTCTGEHGIGIGKKSYLLNEIGEPAVNTMRRLKLALDPLSILNPGKVFTIDPNSHHA